MNKMKIEGNWEQIQGKIRQQWGKLTDDEIMQTRGDYDRLIGLIESRYGAAKKQIHEQFVELLNDKEAERDKD